MFAWHGDVLGVIVTMLLIVSPIFAAGGIAVAATVAAIVVAAVIVATTVVTSAIIASADVASPTPVQRTIVRAVKWVIPSAIHFLMH